MKEKQYRIKVITVEWSSKYEVEKLCSFLWIKFWKYVTTNRSEQDAKDYIRILKKPKPIKTVEIINV